ncbi:MAG: response regulator [Nocardioidaceae bacterium]|nr:response regulator [Nocardioidaceae bacterium]
MVDDQRSLRSLIRMNLELEDIDVVEATDGRHGLELAQQHVPDLVTLDLVMPRMDGLAAAAALRSDPRTLHAPLVMVTTSTSPAHLARARSIGVDAYLTKPFDPDELVRVVRELLTTGHGRDESGGAAPIP